VAPMRKLALALVLGLVAQAAGAVRLEGQQRPLYREGEVLVRYHESALAAKAQTLRARHGLASRGVLHGNPRLELLELPRFTTTADAIAMLREDPAVEIAEPNYLRYPRIACPDNAGFFCPDDTEFDEQWGLRSIGQLNYASTDPALASVPGADMDMLLAWDPGADGTFERVGDASVVIAIIDDGITPGHPDLIDNLVAGFDFAGNDATPTHGNGQGHGTLVAGAAGAKGNNGFGVAGTAWNAKLMPLRFAFDSAGHINAMGFAANNGADIINASFGGPGFSQNEADTIADLEASGIIYIAASGNDDSNTDVAHLNYPANYDAPNIVSVAATNRQDSIASFSQYGAITTDVAAPGLQIVTTQTGTTQYSLPNNCATSGVCGVSGTSFSAPYVAGIAALIKSAYPSATPGEIKARLIESGETGDEVNLRTAGGRVNAYNALQLAPRPALVITAVDWVDGNEALDPGESLSVDITIQNLWQSATNVSGTLAADDHATVSSGAVDFGDIPPGGTATARFDLDVDVGLTQHEYVHFTLDLTADGGYTAARGFIGEIGALQTDTLVTQTFAARDLDLYDEFHAWHYDFNGTLPVGHNQLVIETTSTAAGVTSPDIDLLARRTVPPEYSITVGINPETSSGFFCTSGVTSNCLDPATALSAGANGTEQVVFNDPTAGTYHVVIVNFAQLQNGLTYTVRAYTRARPAGVIRDSGGAPDPFVLGLMLLAALGRRARK
jgi:hypothetical protein